MINDNFETLRELGSKLLSVKERKAYLHRLIRMGNPDTAFTVEAQNLDREERQLQTQIEREEKRLEKMYDGYEYEKD